MKQYEVVEKYLEDNKAARERSNKDKALLDIMLRSAMFPTIKRAVQQGGSSVDYEELLKMVQTYASIDRCWRKVLEVRPELRGSDYGRKEELEEKKLKELGYPTGGQVSIPFSSQDRKEEFNMPD